MTDFEPGLYSALEQIYHGATAHGCCFHYAKALWKNTDRHGIRNEVRGNEQAAALLRKYYALALLPPLSIGDALIILRQDAYEETFRGFSNYVEREWVQRVGCARFSVFQQRHRTNNLLESYHNGLRAKVILSLN